MNLTDDQKEQITAEEVFRQEIQKHLSDSLKPKSRYDKTQLFLKSPIGVFAASSIFVPLIISFFSLTQNYIAKSNSNDQMIKLIDYEITYRIRKSVGKLDDGGIRGFRLGMTTQIGGFPSFSGTDAQILMIQLEDLVEPEERLPIRAARESLLYGDKESLEKSLNIRGWFSEKSSAQHANSAEAKSRAAN